MPRLHPGRTQATSTDTPTTPGPPGATLGASGGVGGGSVGAGVVLPASRTAVRTRRRPMMIFGAIAAILLAGLLTWYVVGHMRAQYSVVVVRTSVARGHTITATDLTTTTIGATSGVSTVPATDLDRLIGQQALIDLASGSLLPQDAIGATTIPAKGQSIVGLKLDPSKVMTGTIAPGSKLRLVVVAAANAAATGASGTGSGPAVGAVFPATLVSMTTGTVDNTQVLANVQISAANAPAVAVLSAAGRIAVVKDSDQ